MSPITKTTYIHIQSKYRKSGTAYNYSVILPNNIVDTDPQYEVLKLTLMDLECYFSWYVVTQNFNTITFTNNITNTTTQISVPEGTYSYYNLAKKITALYPACQCTWRDYSNKFEFAFSQLHTLSFDGIYQTLGFDYGEQPSGTNIASSNVLIPLTYPNIVMHLNNITPVDNMLTLTNTNGEITPSTMLGIIPINASPFQLIKYEPNSAGERSLYSSDNSLNALEIEFKNIDGVPLTYMPEHSFHLKVEVLTVDNNQETQWQNDIREMKMLLKDIFMLKALKR